MSPESVRDPYAALRLRGFRFYASAWTLAVLGQQMQSVALGWDLYQKTGDTMVLGWIGLLQAIPVMALALPAGHLADRFDRKKILMVSQIGSVTTSIGLVLCVLANAPVHAYYVLLFFDAVMNAIGWPARSAIVPQLVPMEKLGNALTWNSSFFQFASVVGPAVGGYLVWLTNSAKAAYMIHAAAGLWFVLCLLTIHTRPYERSREPMSVRSLLAGIQFVCQQKIILATITLDLFAVLLGGATYLLPAVSKDILHVGSLGFGFLRAAPAVGAICMAVLLAHLPPMKHAGRAMLYAVAGFGIATLIFGLSRSFAVSIIALFLTGAMDNISVVVRHTLVQVLTPDDMRGRVSAVNGVFIGASNELGGFESGFTAKLFSVTASIVGGGIGTLIVVAGVDRLFPQVRAFGSLTDARSVKVENEEPTPVS